jgi:hypothetical protein
VTSSRRRLSSSQRFKINSAFTASAVKDLRARDVCRGFSKLTGKAMLNSLHSSRALQNVTVLHNLENDAYHASKLENWKVRPGGHSLRSRGYQKPMLYMNFKDHHTASQERTKAAFSIPELPSDFFLCLNLPSFAFAANVLGKFASLCTSEHVCQ